MNSRQDIKHLSHLALRLVEVEINIKFKKCVPLFQLQAVAILFSSDTVPHKLQYHDFVVQCKNIYN